MTDYENRAGVAEFNQRDHCIACGSAALATLDSGRFGEEPHRSLIESSPWGVCPLPHIGESTWELVRCRECAQVFHKRVLNAYWQEQRFREWMTEEAIRQFEELHGHNTSRARFDRARGHATHLLRLEKMTRALRRDSAVRILDYGCGWGEFLALAGLFGFEAYGIDRDADRRKSSEDLGVRVYSDFESLDAALEGRFHAATLFQVLEHLEDPLAVLLALRQRLVEGAILVLEVPDCSGIVSLRTEAEYLAIDGLDHINAFSPGTLRRIAERAGFSPVEPHIAHATAELWAVVKREIKRVGRRFLKPTTNQYFRRMGDRPDANSRA